MELDNSRLCKKVFLWDYELLSSNNWSSSVRTIMSLVGMDDNFQQMLKCDINTVRNNLMDICATKWHTNLSNFLKLGLITSSQSIAYAISKFVCGILADVVSPKALNSGGLILSGITAISFTGFNSTIVLCFWWFLNGLSQGAGWPAAAVILKQWCPPTIFGTVWSILSTSMNIAGTFGPLITATFIASIGWRESMRLAGKNLSFHKLIYMIYTTCKNMINTLTWTQIF
ncbi:SLC37A4 [Mytilus edulis]|uniref:SLC37A4 n=1 Tax=Mytilus edulis TaxID=6550 RepID=A0A8S3RUY5_MYTED|nr:SLC37A4 [Mytilus edulis]